ncbi:hypothetical protein ACBJ59_57855 [Nonomuraea sp. MTCD27]|uniref:hypothetical protein n=1 Tax=Nonomuraea sp. MTCD27 TaxID=1676747 RepID=UPI0035C13341
MSEWCGVPPPGLDATGKIHNPGIRDLPSRVPDRWTTEVLQNLADDLRKSIKRQEASIQMGEDPARRRRIHQEERLLRQIEKKLSGTWVGHAPR